MSGTILRNALYLANPVQLGNSRPTTPRPTPSAPALPQIGGSDPNPPATVESGGERGRHRRTSQIDRNDQISNDYEISVTPSPGVQGRAAINAQSGPQPGNNRGRFTAEGTLHGRGARLAASLTTNVDPNGRATVAAQGSARLDLGSLATEVIVRREVGQGAPTTTVRGNLSGPLPGGGNAGIYYENRQQGGDRRQAVGVQGQVPINSSVTLRGNLERAWHHSHHRPETSGRLGVDITM